MHVGLGVGVGEKTGLEVGVGLGDGRGEGVPVGERDGVAVGRGVDVGVRVLDALGVAVSVRVGVRVGVGGRVCVAVRLNVGVGVGLKGAQSASNRASTTSPVILLRLATFTRNVLAPATKGAKGNAVACKLKGCNEAKQLLLAGVHEAIGVPLSKIEGTVLSAAYWPTRRNAVY